MASRVANDRVEVRQAGAKGLGVFARVAIPPGGLVEECPALVIPRKKASVPKGLEDYYFPWDGGYAVALGYGSLYNHSPRPNCVFEMRAEERLLVVTACRAVRAGSELTFDYTAGGGDPLWFEVL